MNSHINTHATPRYLLASVVLLAGLALPLTAAAALVNLATAPLVTSTTSSVKPNIMFILDNSGSMGDNFLPDWAGNSDPFTGTAYTSEPYLQTNNGFNGVAYNPAIAYLKPVFFNADGTLNTTTYPDMLSPWTTVKRDGYGIQSASTDNLVGNASSYVFVFGEYCSSAKMTSCVASTVPITIASINYNVPAKLRWCNSAALTNCQSINNATYKWPRYPRPATATINVTLSTAAKTVTQITVNGQNIMSAAAVGSNTASTTASNIRNAINNCTAAITGACTVAGYSATVSGALVTITSPAGAGGITYLPSISGTASTTVTAFSGGVPGSNIYTNIVSTTASYPYPGSASKASTRTDCAGTTCTYAEEMNNYANWWAYYHTRMQSMKTAVSRSFKTLDSNYRVGFSTISYTGATDGAMFLGNNTFELTQKNSWYKKLFAQNPSPSTPLRGALSKVGLYYAHKIAGQVDPVQYSCQQNFAMLSTDGYWNTNLETGTYGPLGLTGANVGNLDSAATTARPLREGTTAVSNTLADVAKYYYDTDLRSSSLNNCSGASSPDYPSGNTDVCKDNVFISSTDNNVQQHMTTFTMGLGADGTLNYTSDYETATSGDFYDLKKGLNSVNWSDPIANTEGERIDDLWHAAVNGRGSYFSAKNPDEIIAGFSKALSAISAKVGSAAAAATSTLNPVAGNNFAYVASYTTVSWKGNLEQRTIDINTGVVSGTASWCAENVVASTCSIPSTVVADTSGSSTAYNCVTPGATISSCTAPGVFDPIASTCSVPLATTCTGTMASKIPTANSDTRTIYTANASASALIPFDSAFGASNPNFAGVHINTLTQWPSLTAAQQTLAAGSNLLNYLRGQYGYENRASNTDKLYRAREAVLGDALESQPSYTGAPAFNYPYPGYAGYIAAQSSRAGTVYMGTNDGMLHAFAADTGIERWAYVPSMVIPNMWQLADTSYATKHRNFVNGSPIISDICTANCADAATAVWKTILVGGLNGGGRGYYALDITNPTTPALLWEFTPTQDADLGYSFGLPVIARKADDSWTVLVTSGYNNTSPGTGVGYLYVLNASDGTILSKISTGTGSTTTPSGLAKISAWNDESAGNKAGFVYGGDLLGNVWRFDINDTVTAAAIGFGSAFKFATLLDASGNAQPITTKPALGEVMSKRIIMIGTGKYLEISDITSPLKQTQYAIKDTATTTLINARSSLVQQSFIPSGSTRTITSNAVNDSDRGWYVDFPDTSTGGSAERANVDSQLVQGVLIAPTIVPSNTVCSPGGYGWLNYFGYDTGSIVGTASLKLDSSIVGINVLYIKGKPQVSIVTSATPTPQQAGVQPPFKDASGMFQGTRVIWRELIP